MTDRCQAARRAASALLLVLSGAGLTACTGVQSRVAGPPATALSRPPVGSGGAPTDSSSTAGPAPSSLGAPGPGPSSLSPGGPVTPGSAGSGPAGDGFPQVPAQVQATVLAAGLRVPWGVVALPDGSVLVGERPTGRVSRISPDGSVVTLGTVPGVADRGEGGLLGLTVAAREPDTLFAYLTTAVDNRVVAIPLHGDRLGTPTVLLKGIPAADHHDGGALTVGPDGNLWIGTGDAGRTAQAQDISALGGKILHLGLDGSVPPTNPVAGSPVWSLGHRNVQGLAFDASGQLWATEFGQNRFDELNRIVPGGNYGWPDVEGTGGKGRFIDPFLTWATRDASPSGLAVVGDVAYVGALRGQRLWAVPLSGPRAGRPTALLTKRFGRLRTVQAVSGSLLVTTSNRDGRGAPVAGDDRLLRVTLG